MLNNSLFKNRHVKHQMTSLNESGLAQLRLNLQIYDHVPVYVGNQPKALCNHRKHTHTHIHTQKYVKPMD